MPSLVRDVMLPHPPALAADASLRAAARALADCGARELLVVDGERLVGEASAAGLLRALGDGADVDRSRAGELAHTVECADADAPLADGLAALERAGGERIPVVAQGRLVGVLARSILVQRRAEDEGP